MELIRPRNSYMTPKQQMELIYDPETIHQTLYQMELITSDGTHIRPRNTLSDGTHIRP